MELIDEMQSYVKANKSADRTLTALSKRAEDIRSRYYSVRAERSSLAQQVREQERAVAALQSQREDLKLEHHEATFEGDQKELLRISRERTNIDQSLNHHHKEIHAAREKLNSLSTDGLETEAATVVMEVEQAIADVPVIFGLLNAATNKARNELQSRASTIKGTLPAYSDAVRREVDSDYRQRKESEEARLAKAEAQRREQEEKAKLTNKVVRDDEGIVIGVRTFDEDDNFVKYTPAKMVSG